MPVLSHRSPLYETVEDRNLQQQFFLLRTCVDVGLRAKPYRYSADVLFALHYAAAIFLDEMPGQYRNEPNHIHGSEHETPNEKDVPNLMKSYFKFLNDNHDVLDACDLAAFALWRLTWIHPFNECNGRAARAFCYLVLCIKFGSWLPGKNNVITIMKVTRTKLYDLLREADLKFEETGDFYLINLSRYLKDILAAQLNSKI